MQPRNPLARLAASLALLLPLAAPAAARGTGDLETEAEVRSAVVALLEAYNAALLDRDARTIKASWSFERTFVEIDDFGLSAGMSDVERRLFLAGVAAGFAQEQAASGPEEAWESLDLRRLRVLPGGTEAVAVTRTRREGLGATFLRWWLTREEGGWRIYDFEDLDIPLRFSTIVSLLLANDRTPAGAALVRAFGAIERASGHVLDQDMPSAAAALAELERELEHEGLPPVLLAMHAMLGATVHFGQGRLDEALAENDRAASYGIEMPVLLFQRANVLNERGSFEQALEMARAYEEALGPDADTFHLVGVALLGLGRLEEAAEMHRRGLDDHATSPENLLALAACLSPGAKAEVGARFRAFEDAAGWFEALATSLLDAGDHEAVGELVAALRELAPGDANADYYLAESLADRGEPWRAAGTLRAVLPDLDDEYEHAIFVDAYLRHCVAAGRALDGYAGAPDRVHAFELLADGLVLEGDLEGLFALAARHREHHPDDPWLAFYEGRARSFEGRFALAEALLSDGHRRTADPDVREWFRYARVDNFHRAGEPMEAWERVTPRAETVRQLLELCLSTEDADLLGDLIAAERGARSAAGRSRSWTDGDELAAWQAHLDYLEGRYAAAVEAIASGPARLVDWDDLLTFYLEEDLVRGLARLGRFDEALEAAAASTERDGDPYYEIVVLGLAGDVEATVRGVEQACALGYDSWQFYADEDLGPVLRGAGFEAFRERFPAPEDGQPVVVGSLPGES